MGLVEQVVAIADALDHADVPWAIGGAIALAYATEEPRGTRDIDVNVFVSESSAPQVFAALPVGVHHDHAAVEDARRDGQVRLDWAGTPVDVFFAVAPFHSEVDQRCRTVPFAGRDIRVLCAEDLTVFKALFDRPKDWVDIATMVESDALDVEAAADRLVPLLGDDPRIDRLRQFRR